MYRTLSINWFWLLANIMTIFSGDKAICSAHKQLQGAFTAAAQHRQQLLELDKKTRLALKIISVTSEKLQCVKEVKYLPSCKNG